MSESITLSTATATIYGSLAGARAYLGAESEDWDVAADSDVTTDMRRALVKARRLLDRLSYLDDYDTFAERDAVDLGTGGGDAAFPFRAASYLLANLGLTDESVFGSTSATDIASMSAGGASITYRNEAKAAATLVAGLPDQVLELIVDYLDTGDNLALIGAVSPTTSDVIETNPFGADADFDRDDPW